MFLSVSEYVYLSVSPKAKLRKKCSQEITQNVATDT